MATQVQNRRGTTAEHSTFTGANGELTVDTTKKTVVVHDGATAGGVPLAKESALSSYLTTANAALSYAPKDSPVFVGNPVGPTPAVGNRSNSLATTAYVVDGFAPIASPVFTGTATAPSVTVTGSTAPTNGLYLPSANSVAISTNGSQRLLIDSTGQVEAAGLGSASAPAWSYVGDPNTGIFSPTADTLAITTGGSERLRVDSNGSFVFDGSGNTNSVATGSKAHINQTATGPVLYIAATGGIAAFLNRNVSDGSVLVFRRSNTEVGSVSVTTTATAYNTSSDYRLKENVTPVTDGITRLQQLKPSRFNFIADPAKTVDGFIAHEVQDVVPEAISGEKDAVDADGKPIYQGIDQSKLVPLLTAALQEAVAKIESLEARLTAAGI